MMTIFIIAIIIFIIYIASSKDQNYKQNNASSNYNNTYKSDQVIRNELMQKLNKNIKVSVTTSSSSNNFKDDSIIDVTSQSTQTNSNYRMIKYSSGVPKWADKQIYSFSEITKATHEQIQFYNFYKRSFINGDIVFLEGNTNYAFILMFELQSEYKKDKNLLKLETQFNKLVECYPATKPYVVTFFEQKRKEINIKSSSLNNYNNDSIVDITGQSSKIRSNKVLVKFTLGVPEWKNQYVYSFTELNQASDSQKGFYTIFKNSFINGIYYNLYKNTNYAFILINDFKNDYESDKNLLKLENQIKKIGEIYPDTKPYGDFILKQKKEEIDISDSSSKSINAYSNSNSKTRNKDNSIIEVPEWKNQYVYSLSEINQASNKQKEFYYIFRYSFLKGDYIDLKSNTNYAFILLFDIQNEYEKDKNLLKLEAHLKKIIEYYPVTKPYVKSFLVKNTHINVEEQGGFRIKEVTKLHSKTVKLLKDDFEETKNTTNDKDLEKPLESVPKVSEIKRKKLHFDAASINEIQKKHSETVELLNEYLKDDFEEAKNTITDEGLDKALESVSKAPEVKRKKLQFDTASIKEIEKKHSETVELLNEYLKDDYEEDNNSVQSQGISKEEVPQSAFVSELTFTVIHTTALELFAKSNFSISQNEFEVFAKSKGVFKNQLIESINDTCYEFLDDVLIEEEDDYYTINTSYFQKISTK